MKIIGIEHIAIATEDLQRASLFWSEVLGIDHRASEEVESEGVLAEIFDTGRGKVELLSELGEESSITKFLEKRGPGIHHICFEVDDIKETIRKLKNTDVELINDTPKIGAEGYRIVFIHPRSTGGVLVELAEKTDGEET